jgi:hypothetical protein
MVLIVALKVDLCPRFDVDERSQPRPIDNLNAIDPTLIDLHQVDSDDIAIEPSRDTAENLAERVDLTPFEELARPVVIAVLVVVGEKTCGGRQQHPYREDGDEGEGLDAHWSDLAHRSCQLACSLDQAAESAGRSRCCIASKRRETKGLYQMRKSLIALATIVPLLALGGIAAVTIPALADSDDDEACVVAPAGVVAGPIDLEAIPTQQVTGPLSVRGAGGDCEDDDDDGRHSGDHHEHDGEDD